MAAGEQAGGGAASGGGPARWRAQRWLVDEAIRTSTIEWDQPRLGYGLGGVGDEQAPAEMALLRSQIRKLADYVPVMSAAAARRERLAHRAEDEGHRETAAVHWFAAAQLWSLAVWPLWRRSGELERLDDQKNNAYLSWARLAGRHVEKVEVPFGDHVLPGWLHLPAGYDAASGALATVLACGGMDGAREIAVRRAGDPLLERGLAVLAYDGPGQGESAVRGAAVTARNWIDAGQALLDFVSGRPELDERRLVASGTSFGSFWTMQIAATQPTLLGVAAALPVFEPGCRTIFEEASPTFKARHMFMAGLFDDEEGFDELARGYDLRPLVEQMSVPWLAIGGEADELSPAAWVHELARLSPAPSTLVLYERARHAMTESPAVALGPSWQATIADWLADRVRGDEATSELRVVRASGVVEQLPHPRERRGGR